jgi:hypothetical protein
MFSLWRAEAPYAGAPGETTNFLTGVSKLNFIPNKCHVLRDGWLTGLPDDDF